MSASLPASPCKGEIVDSKWFAVNSCVDLLDEDDDDQRKTAISAARSTSLRKKQKAIESFIEKHRDNLDDHVNSLRDFARTQGGLLNDSLRRVIWPVLARNLPQSSNSSYESDDDLEELSYEDVSSHKEWNQVRLDVQRTLARFPPNINEEERDELQEKLSPLIVKILSGKESYQYYQGLHDVFLTLLLVLGSEKAEEVGRILVRKGIFYDYLTKSLDQGVMEQLHLIYVLLSSVNKQLEEVLRRAELSPIFALSWPLTWFSHSLHSYKQIVRVFDVFLSSDPLLPIYISATCILYRKEEVFRTEPEMPYLHRLLGNLPASLPIDSLVSDALYILVLIPPNLLQTRYLAQYRENVQSPSQPTVQGLTRYAVQVAVVAGALSAAAGYYFMAKSHFLL